MILQISGGISLSENFRPATETAIGAAEVRVSPGNYSRAGRRFIL
jgi:hypothetical protein